MPWTTIVRARLSSPDLLAPVMRERQAFQCHNSAFITYISGWFPDSRQVESDHSPAQPGPRQEQQETGEAVSSGGSAVAETHQGLEVTRGGAPF